MQSQQCSSLTKKRKQCPGLVWKDGLCSGHHPKGPYPGTSERPNRKLTEFIPRSIKGQNLWQCYSGHVLRLPSGEFTGLVWERTGKPHPWRVPTPEVPEPTLNIPHCIYCEPEWKHECELSDSCDYCGKKLEFGDQP